MTDIFQHWKNNRFVTVDHELLDGPEVLVILTDISFWAQHAQQLETWCLENNSVPAGMTVTFPDEKTLTAFCLKWV